MRVQMKAAALKTTGGKGVVTAQRWRFCPVAPLRHTSVTVAFAGTSSVNGEYFEVETEAGELKVSGEANEEQSEIN